jgi:hypothetical protein
MPPRDGLPEPWLSFFDEVDQLIQEPVELHCLGGFVVIHLYGVARTTNDCDFLTVVPDPRSQLVTRIGGRDSELHKRYRVYLDHVVVAQTPDGYEDRLIPLFPGRWTNLKLFALEAHDIALAKLTRNYERDRDDVQRLARAGHLDPEILKRRYVLELRPYLLREAWHDQTLEMWLESYWGGTPNG